MSGSIVVPRLLASLFLGWLFASPLRAGYDSLADALSEQLRVSTSDARYRASIRGRADVSVFQEHLPAANLRYSEDRVLVAPQARLFVDAQAGDFAYAFAQVRIDRGFDPGQEALEARVDEFALRFARTWPSGTRASFQIGRFATVFGGWPRHHQNWEYPFATAPLAHENLVGLWDSKGSPTPAKPAAWAHIAPPGGAAAVIADERNRVPVIWGPAYATGVALVLGDEHREVAMEIKNVGLSARPSTWDDTDSALWREPAVAGRFGWRPATGWDLGLSAARGIYLAPDPVSVASGHSREDYIQTTFGADLAYEWRHLLLWAELVAARFAVPGAGDADTFAATFEARYKLDVRWAAALRLDWQGFRDISTSAGDVPWGRDVWRIEAGPTLRIAAQTQMKLFASLRHEAQAPEAWNPGAAFQFSLRF